MKIIDLTHTLSNLTPTYDLDCGFDLSIKTDYENYTEPNIFRTQEIKSIAGIGTHMDAPAHCFPGAKTIDLLQIGELISDCVVIKIETETKEDYIIMPDIIEKFEKENGKINPNSFVIFYTGWDKYWDNPKKYRNNLSFPSVHKNTAELLIQRGIVGLGIDTLSPDTGKNSDFPVHRTILGAGKYLVENIVNAKELPAIGAKIYVLPIKIKDGTEAPIRLIAVI